MWQRHDQIAIAGTRGSVNPGRRMRVLARNRTGSTEQKGREQMSPKEMAMLRERLERVRREYGAAWRDTLVLQTHMFEMLLVEVDLQQAEIARLHNENAALREALRHAGQ